MQQRGEGEKQIEVDRRLLRRQKSALEEELEHVRTHRQLHRTRRKDTGAITMAEDKLFATLDPTTRRVRLGGGQELLFTDTVGFVQRLPTTLVAAFRATLEEVAEADFLVHVVDASSPSLQCQVEAVERALEEIGERPIVIALNKTDVVPCDVSLQLEGAAAHLPAVRVSALHGTGVDELLRCIGDNLQLQFVSLDVLIPNDRGELVAQFHQFGTIEHESYEQGGTDLRGHMPQNHSGPFAPFRKAMSKSRRV